ncbi:PaaI family thioesterase [Sphingomonas sinipercae]|uniref:PaaI family thioesterase n=1 Tax=Sphingomonas sinipercae TaxID=2714944 RepID=A0A6G7ZP08_9SPHN|nr:PaaI family thioesterase [Sphingomonas sinipercae]QIL02665.1 PaaI family thioesterase [Sphingomonas sinipercae]
MSSPLDADGAFDAARFVSAARQLGHTRALGLEYGGHGDNWAELSLPWRQELVGVAETGVLASGAIVSLVDTASGLSVWVTLGRFSPIVTLNLRLDYLRPAAKGETIVAHCTCEKLTRRIGFVRGIAHGGDPERPIALSSATFMLNR